MENKSRKRIIIFSIILTIFYIWILSLTGLFGVAITEFMRIYSVIVLKYALAIVGVFACAFLPIRVTQALEKRREIEEEVRKEMRARMALENEQRLQQKILTELKKSDYYE